MRYSSNSPLGSSPTSATYDTICSEYAKSTISNSELDEMIASGEVRIDELQSRFILYLQTLDITLSRENFCSAQRIISLLTKHNAPIDALLGKDGVGLILWIANIGDDSLFKIADLRGRFLLLSHRDQITVFKRLFYFHSAGIFTFNAEALSLLIYAEYEKYAQSAYFDKNTILDLSTCIVLHVLRKYSKSGEFPAEGDLYKIFTENTNVNAAELPTIEHYFDRCEGLRHIYPTNAHGAITTNGNYFEISFEYNAQLLASLKAAFPKREYNPVTKRWNIPLQFRESVVAFARKHNFTIDGGTEYLYCLYSRARNKGYLRLPYYNGYYDNELPTGLPYFCEGAKCLKQYRGFDVWRCRNMDCYEPCRSYHQPNEWEKFSLLDFLRILDLPTEGLIQTTSVDNTFADGKYLQFVGCVNRFREVLSHLYCRSCGKILLPVETSNYNSYAVTVFRCYNQNCDNNGDVYINHCMNGHCNAVIDMRDTKLCPNGWRICRECVSCCDHDMASRGKSLAEKRGGYIAKIWGLTLQNPHNPTAYFCPECGTEMSREDDIYVCGNCKIKFKPRFDTFRRCVKGLSRI